MVPRLPAFSWCIGLPCKFDNNCDNNPDGKLWTMVDTDHPSLPLFKRESGHFGHRWTVLAGLKVRSSTAELRARPFPNRIWSAPVLTTGSACRGRMTVAASLNLDTARTPGG